MRKPSHPDLEKWRMRHGPFGSDSSLGNTGAFEIPFLKSSSGGLLRVISSDGGMGWEHVSVSLADRIPTWEEMCFVKDIFWDEEETVVQYHPARSKSINFHPYCLHLWKKNGKEYELPPEMLIGPRKG